MIKKIIKNTFDMRDGEITISFLMQLYVFIIITVLLIVKPTVNALFLSNLGANHLPYGYLLIAIIAIFSSYFYNKAINAFSLKNVSVATLLFFSISFLLLSFILKTPYLNSWTLYVYYIMVDLFAVISTSQFWVLANLVYNPREAKRLFGFIGAGAIAGGIFGGYLTTLLAPYIGNKYVILVAALLIVICIPILLKIWKMRINKLNIYVRKQKKTVNYKFNSSFKLIKSSKHLTYLSLIFGVSVIIAKLVDFQFSDFANKAFKNPNDLASFFGFWFSSFNVLALLIQLFLTNKILYYLGVTSALLILPLSIAIGCLLFLTFPELWVLVFLKGVDGSFKQSINKASFELSIIPISSSVRNQAKSYIDVVVDSVATGVSGFILLFIIKKLELSSSYITVISILFLFIWLVLVYKLRDAYFDSFRNNLQKAVSYTEDEPKQYIKETTIKSASRILNTGNEKSIITLLKRINSLKLAPLKENIINLLDHPSSKVKAATINQLYKYDKGTAADRVKKLLFTNDTVIVIPALHYLMEHTAISDELFFNNYLDNENSVVAAAALECLAELSVNNPKTGNKYGLYDRITEKLNTLTKPENLNSYSEIGELLLTIGYSRIPKFYPFITNHLQNTNSYIVKKAIKAAGLTSDERYIDELMDFLSKKIYRETSIKALKKFGPEIINTILKLDKQENIRTGDKKYLPRVVEAFKNKNAIKVLLRLARSKDIEIRTEAIKSLLKFRRKNVDLNVNQKTIKRLVLKETKYYRNSINITATLNAIINSNETSGNSNKVTNDTLVETQTARKELLFTIEEQVHQNLKQIFRLLSLIHDRADIDVVYNGLLSEIKDAKINALEFLDNLLQVSLKTNILPLIEYHIIDNKNRGLSSFQLKKLTEKQVLKLLISQRGKKVKMSCLNLIMQSQNPSYLSLVIPLKKHKNDELRNFAKKTISVLRTKNTSLFNLHKQL